MNSDAYMERIGYSGPTEPTEGTLRGLHLAHLLAVPFENLDIHVPREIVLDVDRIYDKIVNERRGGFCYEQNGLFGAVLRELGFEVTLLSARVARPDGGVGPEFDHLLLRVDLDEPWLADVGFGDSFREPIRLHGSEQAQDSSSWWVAERGRYLVLLRSNDGGGWKEELAFTLQPRDLSEFAAMCRFHQTSPESHFTRNRVCSIATANGRVSLTGDRLIITRDGVRNEEPVEDGEAWYAALQEHFGIVLQAEPAS